jgi:hypothetical protein
VSRRTARAASSEPYAAVESVPPEKIVLSSPSLTVAEREVTVVMNWRTFPEMREGRRLIVVRGEVNLDLSMPPKRTVPDVASGEY